MATTGQHTGYDYPVLTGTFSGPLPRLRKFVIPDTGRTVNLRDGSVGFCLVHFATWWNDKIHPLGTGIWDEWGWAPRPVRGSTTVISEHAAGSAVDLDATQHPRGVPILRTFKSYQVSRIHTKLKQYTTADGVQVLDWGGDYKRTVDGMHVERAPGNTLSDCEEVARALMTTPRGRKVLAANPGLSEVILS